MRKIFSLIEASFAKIPKPARYAILYFTCIPFFAWGYYLQRGDIKSELHLSNFITCLYFSAVTITTVGYGDISPKSLFAQITVIIESVGGLFIIGLFLNALAQRQSDLVSQNEKAKAILSEFNSMKSKILRYHTILSITIHDYKLYTFALTTPTIIRTINKVEVNPDFHFKDMTDLYEPTLFEKDMYEPAVKLYFERQDQLISDIKGMLINIELEPWPVMAELCEKFLMNCNSKNVRDVILKNMHDEQLKGGVVQMIKNQNNEPDYIQGDSPINPYVALYQLVKSNLTFLDQYQMEMEKIRAQQQP
jgi:hypothetical protein